MRKVFWYMCIGSPEVVRKNVLRTTRIDQEKGISEKNKPRNACFPLNKHF